MAVTQRKCRATGTVIVVGRAEELGLDPEDGAWVAVCDDHGEILSCDTRRLADYHGVYPEWCSQCRKRLYGEVDDAED